METSAANPKPTLLKLLGTVLLATSLCFVSLIHFRHMAEEHLLAAGFLPWGSTGFYIRTIPGHSLALVQNYTTAENLADAVLPSAMAGFVAFLLSIFWFRRVIFPKKPKNILWFLLPVPLVSLSLLIGIDRIIAPPQVTINLDANTISAEFGPLLLNQIGSFSCDIVYARKTAFWEVRVQNLNGSELSIIPVNAAPPLPQYDALPDLIAQTLSDFIVSHGTKFPVS